MKKFETERTTEENNMDTRTSKSLRSNSCKKGEEKLAFFLRK